mmetsp:Transcript_8136/g.16393  ORF Transcript_8136/g.16393 Transcript_8136/m.16393 type:complete len:455 (+) Transcript_8136:72-1436(+)
MAGKRRRVGERGVGKGIRGKTGRRKEEDEEIVSDDDDDDDEFFLGGGDVGPANEPVEGRDHELEVAHDADITEGDLQSRRLKLARQYLTEMGIERNQDESGEDSDGGVPVSSRQGKAVKQGSAQADGLVTGGIGVRRFCKGHRLPVTCVAMTADDKWVATGSKDKGLWWWDLEAGKAVVKRKDKSPPLGVAISHDNLVATGGRDGVIRVWDLRDRQQSEPSRVLRGHRGPINALAFQKANLELITASDDRTCRLWDVGQNAFVEALFGHGAQVNCVEAISDQRALSGGRDGSARWWKIADGSHAIFNSTCISVDAIAVISDTMFVAGGDDGSLSLWNTGKKNPLWTMEHAHGPLPGNWITAVGAPRSTDIVVSASNDGFIRFWKYSSKSLNSIAHVPLPGFVNGIRCGAHGSLFVAAVGQEHRFGRWERNSSAKNGIAIIGKGTSVSMDTEEGV